jgi:hypothetical protein
MDVMTALEASGQKKAIKVFNNTRAFVRKGDSRLDAYTYYLTVRHTDTNDYGINYTYLTRESLLSGIFDLGLDSHRDWEPFDNGIL